VSSSPIALKRRRDKWRLSLARLHFLDQLDQVLHEADVVICSTGAPDYVVTAERTRKALERRRNRPTCFIDISVPRNIDPAVSNIPNVFLFDIDDLESVISSNIREREREAERAELIVQSEVMQFQQKLRLMDIGPSIGACDRTCRTLLAPSWRGNANDLATHERSGSCDRVVADVDRQQDLTSHPQPDASLLRIERT
jgi:glutamyl-tRNA reductase